MSERRIKKSPLVDVAGMLRSLHYAMQMALFGPTSIVRDEDIKTLQFWGAFWYRWNSVAFMQSYLETVNKQQFLPNNTEDLSILLHAMLIEKAIYEINYELNNRPNWISIPCRGLLELLA